MEKSAWTDADTESMFAMIGKYVIIFQWVEGLIDQCLLLGWGHENWGKSQSRLARMSNYEKIKKLREMVLQDPVFARARTRPEWIAHFESIMNDLHKLRETRNSLVHSQYLFEFTKIGMPPLRSLRTRGNAGDSFDQVDMDKSRQKNLLAELGQTGVDMNVIHVQLIHDYIAHENKSGSGLTKKG
ncbi:hypothetical protein [Bosea sp. RAC05]|uniref:hypothetical protein n=1 Tax=Bosea sp. RAC05 TaxID=1842539 RepID=UPI0012378583|nr:hypothetical protein [Bosea sp. RAC05]